MFEIHPSQGNVEEMHPGKKGFAKAVLNYQLPNDTISRKSFYDFPFSPVTFNELPPSYRLASSAVMFGGLLKKSKYMQRVNWDDTIELASQSYDANDVAQKEFIGLLEKAKKIYAKEKKKKKPQPETKE
jgi:Ca-activated chloride channel family protein